MSGSPLASARTVLARSSSLMGCDTQPLARRSPSVAGRDMVLLADSWARFLESFGARYFGEMPAESRRVYVGGRISRSAGESESEQGKGLGSARVGGIGESDVYVSGAA